MTKVITGKRGEFDFMLKDEQGLLLCAFVQAGRKLTREQKSILKSGLAEIAKKFDELERK